MIKRILKAFEKRSIIFLVNMYFKILFYLRKTNKKKNILIYTDSRGFLVNCILCDKTPYKSYIEKLSFDYNITYQLCPHKHTTILDFLNYINNKNLTKNSKIILHLGIVDFSPRPISQFHMVFDKKNKIVKQIFRDTTMNPNCYIDLYYNEKTFSLYDLDFLEYILNKLTMLSKSCEIIWIGLNKVDLNWNGNYFKKRPNNINNILKYQNYIKKFLEENRINTIKYIDIDELDGFSLREHTVDNMHLTENGFNFIYENIMKYLEK